MTHSGRETPESQIQDLIRKSLVKLVPAGAVGLFPFSFQASLFDRKEYRISSPLVGTQLVYTDHIQVLSYMVVDIHTLVKLGKLVFPKLDRKESLSMVISATEEMLNTASAKIGFLLGKVDGKNTAAITPPMLTDLSGENGVTLPDTDSTFLRMTFQEMAIEYAVTVQMA